MLNYAKGLAFDKNNTANQNCPPPFLALARQSSENATASSVITLTQDTTAIELGATGGAAVMRWVATSDTQASVVGIAGATANFDHLVPTGTVRRFVIPIESNPATGYSSQMGANRLNGLYRRVAYMSVGIASVMLSEY